MHTQVAMAVWGLQGRFWEEGGGQLEGRKRAATPLYAHQGSGPHPVPSRCGPYRQEQVQGTKDMEVSSNNQRTSGGQSLTNETPSCFKSNDPGLGSAEE